MHVIMNLIHFGSQISRSLHENGLLCDIVLIQVESPYDVMLIR